MSTKEKVFRIKDLEAKYGHLTVGRFLSSWRKAEGMNQKEFAEKIGISPANLCDIEKGRKGLSIFKATDIAKKVGYSPTVLVQLALQDLVKSCGLDYRVEVKGRAA